MIRIQGISAVAERLHKANRPVRPKLKQLCAGYHESQKRQPATKFKAA